LEFFKKNEEDNESHIIDSTIIRAHQDSAGARRVLGEQAIGKSRGGKSTKIHWLVDGLGLPIDFKLTGGQVDDSTMAIPLLTGKHSKYVIADKAYDTNANRVMLENSRREAVIPNSKRRAEKFDYDCDIYKERTLVECFIGWTKKFRRIATRYEKLSSMYSGLISITCILAWLR
jgi:transposase